MAILVSNIVLDSGIIVESAYVRIDNINGGKGGCAVSLLYFVNKQTSDNGGIPFMQKGVHFIPSVADDAPNYHKQGYEYVKTIPEFADAVDA